MVGKYNVFLEMIRRVVKILEDIGVVKSIKGKGVIVLFLDKVFFFIKKYRDIINILLYKLIFYNLIDIKFNLENEILDIINKILDYFNRFEIINFLVFV